MRAALWAGVLVMAMMAGCLGGIEPAGISEQTLQQKGWKQADSNTKSVAMGAGELATKEYRSQGSTQATGVTVATTNNVPILDERRFIPQALEKVEKKRGIDFNKAGTTTVTLPQLGGDEVDANVYTFTKDGANGKAVLITPTQCDAFVISVGYGVTGTGGLSASNQSYQQAKDVARNVVC